MTPTFSSLTVWSQNLTPDNLNSQENGLIEEVIAMRLKVGRVRVCVHMHAV